MHNKIVWKISIFIWQARIEGEIKSGGTSENPEIMQPT